MLQFDRKRFGLALRNFRKDRTYRQLAHDTGVEPATLARFENGIRVDNEGAFRALCQTMGCRPADFPKPDVTVPRVSHALSRAQWGALLRAYRYRNNEYIRESAIGSRTTVANLVRLNLVEPVNMRFRRLPYVRITDAGVMFYEEHEIIYRERYLDLYETSEFPQVVL